MPFDRTHWWKIDERLPISQLRKSEQIKNAAQLLREGGLVAFPTETVYGLGADATSSMAVRKIFAAKGRPSDNPLIVHLGAKEQIAEWIDGEIPSTGKALLEAFVPGPLTLIFRHNGKVVPEVTAGLSTVGVRIPEHPVAQALLQLADRPVAAPSANRSGRPSPTEAGHVWDDLNGKLDVLLDGGSTAIGLESTVVDVTGETPVVLRPGGISLEMLQQVVPCIQLDLGLTVGNPRSPGMKYRHYAPKAEMLLVEGKQMVEEIKQRIEEFQKQGKKVGVLTTVENQDRYRGAEVVTAGSRESSSSVAKGLFRALRRMDELEVDIILAETFPERGLYFSVMNRLRKAARGG